MDTLSRGCSQIKAQFQSRPRSASFQVGGAPDNPGGRREHPDRAWAPEQMTGQGLPVRPSQGPPNDRGGPGPSRGRAVPACSNLKLKLPAILLQVRSSASRANSALSAPNRQWVGPLLNFAVKKMTPTRDRRAISESAAPDRTKPQVASAVSLTSTALD